MSRDPLLWEEYDPAAAAEPEAPVDQAFARTQRVYTRGQWLPADPEPPAEAGA